MDGYKLVYLVLKYNLTSFTLAAHSHALLMTLYPGSLLTSHFTPPSVTDMHVTYCTGSPTAGDVIVDTILQSFRRGSAPRLRLNRDKGDKYNNYLAM